ncbi:hypothetical protein [uncultured Microbulbifer sp.]|uniref:hypothetical protein n=1 Tax=uncultured Microbulbifer sp. TaxID=348147 RepID=UPI0026149C18|nr:hypothetical protein [uncultured Microbulbifer sp.]
MINVIIGPPCAGKTTHISNVKHDGDVVVDFDQLALALGSEVSHGSEGAVRSVAFACRNAAIDEILAGLDSNSWIIHSRPNEELLQRYVEAGAAFTVISPGLDVCLERAEGDGRPEGTEEIIRDWYENPPDIPGYTHEGNQAYNHRTPLYARLTEIAARA